MLLGRFLHLPCVIGFERKVYYLDLEIPSGLSICLTMSMDVSLPG